MNATRWQAWLAAAAIFVFGLALGTAGMAVFGIRAIERTLEAPPQPPAQMMDQATARIAGQLRRDLDLDAEAEARVRAELRRAAVAIRRLRVESNRELQAEIRAASARIAAELPPEKRAQLEGRITQQLRRFGMEGQPPMRQPGLPPQPQQQQPPPPPPPR